MSVVSTNTSICKLRSVRDTPSTPINDTPSPVSDTPSPVIKKTITNNIIPIVVNDGKQNRLLMATPQLNTRLGDIWRQKKAFSLGLADDDKRLQPTLLDIEKTHEKYFR
jgi:hypothetical protein